MDLDLQFPLLKQQITKTSSDLDLSESTAAILLAKYEWNTAQLYSDYSILRDCPREAQTVEIHTCCSLCGIFKTCSIMNCGDCICLHCLRGSVQEQMSANRLILNCPLQTCNKYINFVNLPHDLQNDHLASLQVDLLKKRSLRGQCVSFVCNHKYAFATTFFTFGYALYTAFTWRKEIGYGLKIISVGSDLKTKASALKTKASALKNLVTSGSKSLSRIFYG